MKSSNFCATFEAENADYKITFQILFDDKVQIVKYIQQTTSLVTACDGYQHSY